LNKILNNYSNSVALDGNPELNLVHATGCKQPSLSSYMLQNPDLYLILNKTRISSSLTQNHEKRMGYNVACHEIGGLELGARLSPAHNKI
jgi:hypothetical protein